MGWGKLVMMHQRAMVHLDSFFGKRTIAMARPSGMLWTANEAEMKTPKEAPNSPPKETPMPIPSLKEWSVITNTASGWNGRRKGREETGTDKKKRGGVLTN